MELSQSTPARFRQRNPRSSSASLSYPCSSRQSITARNSSRVFTIDTGDHFSLLITRHLFDSNKRHKHRMLLRSLTFAQKQKLTNTLFWTCAAGSVIVVALPSILPCPAIKSQKAGLVYAEDGKTIQSQPQQADTRQVLISSTHAKQREP